MVDKRPKVNYQINYHYLRLKLSEADFVVASKILADIWSGAPGITLKSFVKTCELRSYRLKEIPSPTFTHKVVVKRKQKKVFIRHTWKIGDFVGGL